MPGREEIRKFKNERFSGDMRKAVARKAAEGEVRAEKLKLKLTRIEKLPPFKGKKIK